jgi:hypothetical protein
LELHATNKSMLAEQTHQLLYEIEREARDVEADLRRQIRQEKAVPVMERPQTWMIASESSYPKVRPSAGRWITA